jgi:phage-related minor tail protein
VKPAKLAKKATKKIKTLTENPIVADVVAAALVAMATALKDSEKAKRMASDASDQLNTLSKKGAKQGNAMWDLALDIGRRTLETITSEEKSRGR